VALRGDHGPACPNVGLCTSVGRDGLLKLLPCAGVGLRQRLLPILLLVGFNLLSGRGHLLRLGLSDGGVLQLDLVGEIVEGCLCGVNASLRQRDLGFIVGGIDLNQEIASLDALEIVHGNG
jgi:hypothetical protein